ncbi:MAG TPA: NifU family protein [Aquaticitalea sp.]|nr:NifU family protein [Aquaticitalea sp.]HNU58433.1 NifU family protein [Aquaticitalea sp.]
MYTMKITIKNTTNPTIIKFEADVFLTQHQSFEFNNIDEATASPLAQQLFYLPFVKKVYISGNFIAVERYNIVEWPDVQEEVAEQIEAYLNSGNPVVKSESAPKKVPVTVYAESTPNPSVMKFVANKKLVVSLHEFMSIDEAAHSPLATELFYLPFVKSVFMDENYISITKYDVAEWSDIANQLREFIRNHIESGKAIVTDNAPKPKNGTVQKPGQDFDSLDDTSKEIIDILEEYVKPAVASDGGNIMFDSYNTDNKTVRVVLQGACSGCPSSTFTLKNGIENILKQMMGDKVHSVEAING